MVTLVDTDFDAARAPHLVVDGLECVNTFDALFVAYQQRPGANLLVFEQLGLATGAPNEKQGLYQAFAVATASSGVMNTPSPSM